MHGCRARRLAMKHVPVPPPRSTFTETADGVELVVPVRRNWLMLAFVLFWLSGWVGIPGALVVAALIGGGPDEMSAAADSARDGRQVSDGSDDEPPAALLVAFGCAWLFGATMVSSLLLWQLGGRLRVRIDADSLVLRRHVGPLGHSRSYRRADVRALRVIDVPVTHLNPFQSGLPFGAPRLAFDYGSATIRFANDLDEAEARDIVRILGERGLVPVERNRHTP